jgi:formylglycine-generating enzyme required for sulfatase activity/serine/threonine protein kinase
VVTAESEQLTNIEGSILNYRYQIDRVLNDKGGMGLIYQATDLNLRGTVVLKKSRFVDEQSRSAFEREARLLYGLRHNALPRVIDYFLTEDQSQFFVMEFIPGKDLSELLSMRIERGEGPFPMEQVLDWYEQLLDALYYLHTHEPPIIHRDIKPQNLKLMPNGQVILLDFGLAKGSVGGMTMGVSIQGYTPNYAPLEQMRGSGTDARSDIYSLAVTMHCLLTGQMPPDAVSRAIETLSAQPDPLRAVHEINHTIPLLISEVIQKACSLNQNERPQTAVMMRDLLRRARTAATGKLYPGQVAEAPAKPVVTTTSAPVETPKQSKAEAAPTPAATPLKPVPPSVEPAGAMGQETQTNALEPNEAALVREPASNGPAAKVAQTSKAPFIPAFAPIKSEPPAQAKPGHRETPAQPIVAVVENPAAQPSPAPANGKGNGHKAPVEFMGLNEAMREIEAPAAASKAPEPARPVTEAKPDAARPIVPPPAAAKLQPQQPVAPLVESPGESEANGPEKNGFRSNSIIVIEHVDEGKALQNGAAQAQPEPAVQAPVRHVAAPPAPKFERDSLQRARMAADMLDKPRQVIVNQKKEKHKEEYFLLGPEPEPNVNVPLAVPDSNLRSFTEVIGFGVRLEMQVIPGGEFMMGSPERRGYADEFPQHKVAISSFYIGRYPVTQKQYRAVMRTNPSAYLEDSHPVESVTWDEAVEFCRRLTIATGRIYRLPTEAEWEYACRAGSITMYNYGDDEDLLNQFGWSLMNSGNTTHPVGEKKPNGWGLCDMHGNVWEWCLDWYDQMYYLQSPAANPNGPTKGTSRVLRGGSRYSLPNYCRSATRSNHQPDQRDALVGFRVVCEARELPT